ncbi:MAG TPA: PadR family transcriptional regulator [Conexibacter sp.]|nr:PadR family transcriptional regulator [Conexibacter sp.]
MTSQTLALLAVLMSDPAREWYGFEAGDVAGIKSGTLYPALARLERARWLSSHWEEVDPRVAGRPRRRLYRLTQDGAAFAREELDAQVARLTIRTPKTLRPHGGIA